MPLWSDVGVTRQVNDDRLAAAIAQVFGVERARVGIFTKGERRKGPRDAAIQVAVYRMSIQGDLALWMELYPQFEVPEPDELGIVKQLAKTLDTACVVSVGGSGDFYLRVWPDGNTDRVQFDDFSDDEHEYIIAAVHGAPRLAGQPQGASRKWQRFGIARAISASELVRAIAKAFGLEADEVTAIERLEQLDHVQHDWIPLTVIPRSLQGDFPLWVDLFPQHDLFDRDEPETLRKLARAFRTACLFPDDSPDPASWLRVWPDGRVERVIVDNKALNHDEFVIIEAKPAGDGRL